MIDDGGHSLDLVDRARRAEAGRTGGCPRETETGGYEPFVEVKRKLTVVGFRDEAVVEVVSAEWPSRRSVLNSKERG